MKKSIHNMYTTCINTSTRGQNGRLIEMVPLWRGIVFVPILHHLMISVVSKLCANIKIIKMMKF